MRDEKSSRNNVIAAERRNNIYRIALDRGSVNAADLALIMGVGISTIRRDLDAMHEEGRLVRVHGGAIVRESAKPRVPYRESRDKHMVEKSAIARAALSFVPESGTIFLGGGTTTYQMAKSLSRDMDISVVTNALDIAAYIASEGIAPVDLIGGTVRQDSLQTNCEEALESLYWDVTFFSPAALDIARGITTDNRNIARQEQMIMRHGGKFVALCDSSKTGRFAYSQVAPVSVIDVLITDSGVDKEFVKKLADERVEVLVMEI